MGGRAVARPLHDPAGRRSYVQWPSWPFPGTGRMPVLSEEVRVLQRSSAALPTEMSISTRARPVEPVRNCRTAAKELRIRAPLLS